MEGAGASGILIGRAMAGRRHHDGVRNAGPSQIFYRSLRSERNSIFALGLFNRAMAGAFLHQPRCRYRWLIRRCDAGLAAMDGVYRPTWQPAFMLLFGESLAATAWRKRSQSRLNWLS